MTTPTKLSTTCCITGGGPAGMMLGLLLARAGIDVMVLEKHADFLRDFRGDTVHPSTLRLMDELGLLDAFLALPHQRVEGVTLQVGGRRLRMAQLDGLGERIGFIAMMPQWHFLDFLARQGRRYPSFRLLMQAEVTALAEHDGRVTGVHARTADGDVDIRADLVVGADGRGSTVRERAGLDVQDFGAPMDVLWLRVPRHPDDPGQVLGHVEAGQLLVMIDRGDYWQCAMVVPKDGADAVRAAGLPALRERLHRLSPWLHDRVEAIASWDDVKVLSVRVDRLHEWSRPGLLCLGDAAHAMSPIGGVGINLAVQDAVAAANVLAAPLRAGRLTDATLRKVQRRRQWPTVVTQWLQRQAQSRLIVPVLQGHAPARPPLVLRWLDRHAFLRRLTGRMIGLGVRSEHVRTPEATPWPQRLHAATRQST